MKYLNLLLIVFFITAVSLSAQVPVPSTPGLQAQLEHKMASLLSQAGTGNKVLKKEMDPDSWTLISWKDFLRLNEEAKKRQLVSVRLDNKAMELTFKHYNIPQYTFTNSAPDYSHAFNHKFIFISEHITHDSAAAPQEVINILAAARKARPNAKILLAQEFLTWDGHPNASLLKKAGGSSPHLHPGYPDVSNAADRFGIDQLALDDVIFYECEKQQIVQVKMGKYLIEVSPSEQLPELNIKTCSRLYNRWVTAEQLAGVSPFGLLERNRQWARRIKAVEKDYDLILVYAGNGHTGLTYFVDLPPLIATRDYADVNLLPQDREAMAALKRYAERDSQAENAQIADYQNLSNEKEKGYDNLSPETKQQFEEIRERWQNWENPKLPLWLHSTQEDFDAANPGVEPPKELKEFIEGHCSYLVYLQEKRIPPAAQEPEVCPQPAPIAPKARPVSANPKLTRNGNIFD